MRAVQYTEFFLIGGNPITGDLRANVYNTIGLKYLPTPLPRSAISESMCSWNGLICSA
jgi:hypothetical protein